MMLNNLLKPTLCIGILIHSIIANLHCQSCDAATTAIRNQHGRTKRRTSTSTGRRIRPPIFQELTRKIISHDEKVNPISIDYGSDGHPWERHRRLMLEQYQQQQQQQQQNHEHDKHQHPVQNGTYYETNERNNRLQNNIQNNNENGEGQEEQTTKMQNRKLQSNHISPSPQNPIKYQNNHHTSTNPISPSDYQPIRLAFHTGALTELESTTTNNDNANTDSGNNPLDEYLTKIRVTTLKERVLPLMSGNFSEMLSVVPIMGTIPLTRTTYDGEDVVQMGTCFGIFDEFITSWDINPGISNTDLVVFVSAFNSLGDHSLCLLDGSSTTSGSSSDGATNNGEGGETVPSTLAGAAGCELDQFDRPIVGWVNFCLDTMEVKEDWTVSQEVVDSFVSVGMHEFTHVLGINSDMMKYFRDANTGEPLTPRPFAVGLEVACAPDGSSPKSPTILPSCTTIKESKAENNRGLHGWMVVLPTVTQVARNQFNCQSLEGVMLENQPTNEFDCFGSHFDERDYYSETMSAYFAQEADFFSPLSFALLQDSGWYWPNYRLAELSPFGHGAGCGFVQNDCIVDGEVPSYSKGFFCNTIYDGGRPQYLCDPSATHKAICDLTKDSMTPSSHQYFPDPTVGPYFDRADWCPIAREGTINCVDGNTVTIFSEGFVSPHVVAEEAYSTDSKCFERVGGDSLCLDAFCSREPHVLTVKAGSNIFTCNSDFQEISFTSSTGDVVEFICPRLSAVCPETFCPANCSGKGVCKFNGVAPYCECFDPNDLSDGCYDSLPKSPAKCEDDNFVHSNENASNRLIAYGAITWSLLFGLLCHT